MNIAAKRDLPIRYIAYGFLLPAEAETIAYKILSDLNELTFQLLRQL